ncbi:TonB-dependent receptor [Stakelama saccharophila]|uniref:TonB-dependent receptor n=1 Tax=Stakelama saccharophila TaxID=3075605 RepID=A0ABZ0BCA1_9SPHN|nr:TonB-dependent receptor [Stakelama sp. W311]WNO54473.1 TonB-dependent receptor [Stakelama sp. W311]
MKKIILLSGTALCIATVAHAQDSRRAVRHEEVSEEIVVTGVLQQSQEDVLSGVSVVSGEELTRDLRPTIGETLAKQPGVSATSFGPNASRPVLRGFQGNRIRVLTDGIGSIDVSNTSVDHAVAINPLTADRIEVLRGPSALLYGSSAIGGVVNVIDSRIPRKMPEAPLHPDAIGTLGSAADERAISAVADVPVSGNIVAHVDGSYSRTDNLETGGHILAPDLRRQAQASSEPAIRQLADLKGELPNSDSETWDVGAGAAVVADGGNLGFVVSHYDNYYGVPVRYALEPDAEAEAVHLHMKQDRVDIRGEVDPESGIFDRIRLRLGAADYQHSEIEDTGEVGTTFYSQGYEGRLELTQAQQGAWSGAIGGQFFVRDFDVVGEEKFLPKNFTQQFGAFTLQSLDYGPLKIEGGARIEHSDVEAVADATLGNPAIKRSFDSVSGSLGASYEFVDGIRIGFNGSRTQRAPTAEELFANGPHAGTQAFEVGNPNFDQESSWGLEGTLKGRRGGLSFSASAYYDWFSDYIYAYQTGAIEDGLPVYQNAQADARYYGVEGQISAPLARIGGFTINGDLLGDYVHATIVDTGPVPRIPPLRLLGGLEAQSDRWNGRVEVEHSFEQDRVSEYETPTDGFTLVNASVSWKPFGENATSLTLQANNIFDVVARRHASFLKDYAPLAGRDIRLTARFQL